MRAGSAGATTSNPRSTNTYTYATDGWGDRLTSYNGTAITYDSMGNPVSYYNGAGTYTFSWSGRQATTIQKDWLTYNFTYNDEGMRTSKTVNGITTNYYVSGTQILAEETNGNVTVYLYDSEGAPLGMQYHGVNYAANERDVFWYERNIFGDIVAVYDEAGTLLARYIYDAYGVVSTLYYNGGSNTRAFYNPFRYRGYYYDRDLSLYYLSTRYYDCRTGRFVSPDNYDVITATPGALTDKNLYAYCDDNPIMRRDDGGAFWDTFFDILSLGMSIADVVANPTDPWAWVGLIGDAVDLIPFVSCVGEATDLVRVATKADDIVDAVDDVHDTAKAIDRIGESTSKTTKMIEGACFVEGTLISTESGMVSIENVKVGMYVYAYDTNTLKLSLKKVVNVFGKTTTELIHIEVNGEKITTTPTHPFWVHGVGWVNAIDLREGDRLQLINGDLSIVDNISHETIDIGITVYNFEVEEYHTYFVSESSILVHNACAVKGGIEINPKKFTTDQDAVIQLAKEAHQNGISRGEADILWSWAQEYGLTGKRYHGPKFDSYLGGNQFHMKINGMHINIFD